VAGPAPRFGWVLDQLALRGTERVVEVGCGHGIAAGLVVDVLEAAPGFLDLPADQRGRYLGVDRSEKMIAASATRNAAAVDRGTAAFVAADVGDAPVERGSVDVVLAWRVAGLAEPAALGAVLSWLGPGGTVVLAFDDPDPARAAATAARARRSADAIGATVGAARSVELPTGAVTALWLSPT